MIHESAPWKERLAKDADLIERWAAKSEISERRSVLIEQKVFVAAYSMRKLQQAGKLSSSFEGYTVRTNVAPLRADEKIDRYNAHRYFDLYDFGRMASQGIAAPDLLDLLIHSLLFSEGVNEDETVTGFFVTSDRKRSILWLVDIAEFLKLMRHVASDYPSEGHYARNLETGEFVEWKGDSEPPPEVRTKMDRIIRSNKKSR